MPTIAIIGSGFSGTLTAVHIARLVQRDALRDVRVHLFDTTGRFGPGVAYSTTSSVHYLNVPAGNMSALDEDPSHFLRWAQSRDISVHSGSFVPRGEYGTYLQALLKEQMEQSPGVITLRHEHITRIACSRDGFEVSSDQAAVQRYDAVVLAAGNAPPPMLGAMHPQLHAHPGYIPSPWSPDLLDTIGPEDSVALIGTGLSMMDVVMHLHVRGHHGSMLALSRHGLLPRPHRSPSRPPMFREPPKAIGTNWDGSIKQLLRAIRQGVREHAGKGTDWRDVITSLRPITPAIWQRLNAQERGRFLRHLRSYWEVVRHRAAPEAAACVSDLLAAKQLTVRSAHVVSVKPADAQRIEVIFRPRRSENVQRAIVDHIVNCLGPQTDIAKVADPLLTQMLRDRLIQADELGLGIRSLSTGEAVVETDAGQLDRTGILIMGPARRAEAWENVAVPELKKQAAQIAGHVLARVLPTVVVRPIGATTTA